MLSTFGSDLTAVLVESRARPDRSLLIILFIIVLGMALLDLGSLAREFN